MLNFEDTYNKFNSDKEFNNDPYRVVVSYEVKNYEGHYEINLDNEEFEIVCEYTYDWILNTYFLSVDELVNNIMSNLKNKNITIDQLRTYDPKAENIINNSF